MLTANGERGWMAFISQRSELVAHNTRHAMKGTQEPLFTLMLLHIRTLSLWRRWKCHEPAGHCLLGHVQNNVKEETCWPHERRL